MVEGAVSINKIRKINMKSKVYGPSDIEFSNIVASSLSYREVLMKCGISGHGGSHTKAKQRIQELGLSTTHFKRLGQRNLGCWSTQNIIPLEEILVENSQYQNRARLKIRLLRDGLLIYRCYICGITEWNGQELPLILDHINGVNDDNRICNLRLVCSNCDSQLPTYKSKNRKAGRVDYCACLENKKSD